MCIFCFCFLFCLFFCLFFCLYLCLFVFLGRDGKQYSHSFINLWNLGGGDITEPIFAPCKSWILDSTMWIPDSRFPIPVSRVLHLRIPLAVFWIPKPKILDSTSKKSPESGFRIPLCRARFCSYHLQETRFSWSSLLSP